MIPKVLVENKINNISMDAPIWRGAKPEQLAEILSLFQTASFHFADDSGAEWPDGNAAVKKAAQHIVELNLGFYAIFHLHVHEESLVTMDQLIDAVFAAIKEGPK